MKNSKKLVGGKINQFLESLLDYCVINTMVEWKKKDPKEEFKKLAHLIILFQISRGWKNNGHRKSSSKQSNN